MVYKLLTLKKALVSEPSPDPVVVNEVGSILEVASNNAWMYYTSYVSILVSPYLCATALSVSSHFVKADFYRNSKQNIRDKQFTVADFMLGLFADVFLRKTLLFWLA